jgi:hypothetical protein
MTLLTINDNIITARYAPTVRFGSNSASPHRLRLLGARCERPRRRAAK